MSNMNERLYDYLTSLTEPKTIKEINDSEEFKNVSRRELGAALTQLQREDIAFRKVVEGKAYYSADPKQGTSRNPMQLFIGNIAGAMNRSLNPASPLEKFFDGSMDVEMEAVDTHSDEIFTASYNENVVVEAEEYSICIPDGFVLERNVDNRDFIAYLPHPTEPDEKEMAPITLFAGQRLVNDSFNEIASAEARMYALKYMTMSNPALNVGNIRTFLNNNIAGMYMYFHDMYAYHLNVYVSMPGCLKMFRLMFMDVSKDSEDKVFEFADKWLSTIVLKKSFPKINSLKDEKYFNEFNENIFNEWKDTYKQTMLNIQAVLNFATNCEVADFKNQRNSGGGSYTLLKKAIRKVVEKVAVEWNENNQYAVDFFNAHKDKVSTEELIEIYKYLDEQFKIEKNYIDLDDEEIFVRFKDIDRHKKEIETDAIKAYLHAEEQRKEAEKKRIAEEKEKERKRKIYREATDLMIQNNIKNLEKAIVKLEAIADFDDSSDKIAEAKQRIEEIKQAEEKKRIEKELARKESIYQEAEELLKRNDTVNISLAREKYESILDYKDAKEKVEICVSTIESILAAQKAAKEAKAKKIKNTIIGILIGIVIAVASFFVYSNVIKPMMTYNSAVKLVEEYQFDEAIEIFDSLGDYKDSKTQILATKYAKGVYLRENNDFDGAELIFKELGEYEDAATQITETYYAEGKNHMSNQKYEDAYYLLESIVPYKESVTLKNQCATEVARQQTDVLKKAEWYINAENPEQAKAEMYDYVINHKNDTDITTYQCLVSLVDSEYKDAKDIYNKLYKEIKVNIIYNSKSTDRTTDKETINYISDSNSVIAHILVTGGYPGQEVKYKYVYERRTGFNNKPGEYAIKGEGSITAKSGEDFTKFLNTGSNVYYHRITLYDMDGNQVFQKEVHTPYK